MFLEKKIHAPICLISRVSVEEKKLFQNDLAIILHLFVCICLPSVAPYLFLWQDPLRTFVGRKKYMRPLWITKALENPVVVRID
jgi:hypothetical protein